MCWRHEVLLLEEKRSKTGRGARAVPAQGADPFHAGAAKRVLRGSASKVVKTCCDSLGRSGRSMVQVVLSPSRWSGDGAVW